MTNNILIICGSTSHMLRASKLLTEAGIVPDLVPVPAEYGSICSTALKISAAAIHQAERLLRAKKVAVEGIYPERPIKLPELPGLLADLPLTPDIRGIFARMATGAELCREELVRLLAAEGDDMMGVFVAANLVRARTTGDVVDVRAAVEFSNYCRRNCCYCGLRRDNTELRRYRMTPEEITAVARQLAAMGVRTIILQSGEDPWYTTEKIMDILTRIKTATGMRITLSIGERSREEYRLFRTAGANNYLLKIETSNPARFAEIHPDDDYGERLEHTRWLKELGYVTGSGNIIGLPDQTLGDIADDLLLMRQMGIHMVGIGPFLPAHHTPLADHPAGDFALSLKTVAVARIYLKNVFIPSTTALATLHPEGLRRGLEVGANTIMFNATPAQYRAQYAIYSAKRVVDVAQTAEAIRAAGRKLPPYLKFAG